MSFSIYMLVTFNLIFDSAGVIYFKILNLTHDLAGVKYFDDLNLTYAPACVIC